MIAVSEATRRLRKCRKGRVVWPGTDAAIYVSNESGNPLQWCSFNRRQMGSQPYPFSIVIG
jgi:hypothetical protein